MNKEFNDKVAAIENADVRIAILAMLNEGMEIKGKYVTTCLEVIPEQEEAYLVLINKRTQLELDLKASHDSDVIVRRIEEDLIDVEGELSTFTMREKWKDEAFNLVTTEGKNHMLDNYITGSAFTQVGPYMGLISSVSFSAIAAADTMASHAGWTEAGSTNAPTFAARIAPAWSAASAGAKAASSAVSFTMTGAGTLKGAFLVLHTGAVVTLMSTAGTLFSAALFSGGDQVVSNGNVVQVSYSLSL